MDDFQLAFQLDLLASSLPLSRGCGVTVAGVGVMREGECAAEEEAGQNRTAEDPRGTDPDHHGVPSLLPSSSCAWSKARSRQSSYRWTSRKCWNLCVGGTRVGWGQKVRSASEA